MSGSVCGRGAGRTPVSLKRLQSAHSAWAPWAINQHGGRICQNLQLPMEEIQTDICLRVDLYHGTRVRPQHWELLKHLDKPVLTLWDRKKISLKHGRDTSSGLTCIVAQTLSLLPPPVQPDAETHEDDPAGSANAGNKSWLFHHIGDLLRDAVVSVSMYDHIPELFTCREQGGRGDINASVNWTLPEMKGKAIQYQLLLRAER